MNGFEYYVATHFEKHVCFFKNKFKVLFYESSAHGWFHLKGHYFEWKKKNGFFSTKQSGISPNIAIFIFCMIIMWIKYVTLLNKILPHIWHKWLKSTCIYLPMNIIWKNRDKILIYNTRMLSIFIMQTFPFIWKRDKE